MKHKEARLCVDHSQSSQLLLLSYLVPAMFPKGEGKRGERGEHTKYLLHLKNGGKGKELYQCSALSTSLSDGSIMLLR